MDVAQENMQGSEQAATFTLDNAMTGVFIVIVVILIFMIAKAVYDKIMEKNSKYMTGTPLGYLYPESYNANVGLANVRL